MGGCRCTFRDCCNNSTNSPGMHFFHFPQKDMARCQKWAEYSGNRNFPQLEASKLRNKVVCETHFRDECFMNYKKERLVQWAVPTLVRLKNGSVLDYTEGDTPAPKYLDPTKLQHLVPPQNRQQQPVVSKEETAALFVDLLHNGMLEEQYETPDDDPPLPPTPPPAKRARLPPPRILNISAPQNVAQSSQFDATTTPEKELEQAEYSLNDDVTIIDDGVDNFSHVFGEESVEQESVSEAIIEEPDVVLKSVYVERELELTAEIEALKSELEAKKTALASKDAELDEMQARVASFEAKAQAASVVTQVETITTSRSTNAKSQPVPPTKAQLFNGIKKYLSPSMAAMVRMEMFGGPERDWKPDEKSVSVELLSLGDQVYNFIRDEWRCRLPPKRDVEQWLNQRRLLNDEEDL